MKVEICVLSLVLSFSFPAFSLLVFYVPFPSQLPEILYHNSASDRYNFARKRRIRIQLRMVFRMTDLEEVEEKRTVAEFCHLFEKSKQLFNGLRDLPPYGHKQWQNYFGRAFDVYTRLWKFQQQHRLVLDKKYMLKRWQIGEIASRIAQLYYHYYLRTSETNYLNEAYQFYGAIKARGYYSKREERGDLMVKKLRYFARFIVVSLLLKRMKNVRELVREFAQHVDEYTAHFEPDDQLEWSLVLTEIRSFIEADCPVAIYDASGEKLVLTFRLPAMGSLTPGSDPPRNMGALHLQEIVIVGSKAEQARFSELTIDMFRMVQTLEREPQDDAGSNAAAIPCLRRENSHKYLLYKPSLDTLLVYMSSGFKDVEIGGVLLIYISGDPIGCDLCLGHGIAPGYEVGGVSMSKKEDSRHSSPRRTMGQPQKCLHPGDILPYTRKPLFLIIDSENGHVFQEISSPFGSPLVVFTSAPELPIFLQENPPSGSILTLFLHCPLSGFCVLTGIDSLTLPLWEVAQTYVEKFMSEASQICLENSGLDEVYMEYFGDDFLRLLILRFIFYESVLKYHRSIQSLTHYPRAQPELRLDEAGASTLSAIILDLANHLSVNKMFFDPD